MAVHHFAPRIKTQALLMMIGKTDERNYSMNDAKILFNLIPVVTKELMIYESGHKLPVEWTAKAVDWMKKYL